MRRRRSEREIGWGRLKIILGISFLSAAANIFNSHPPPSPNFPFIRCIFIFNMLTAYLQIFNARNYILSQFQPILFFFFSLFLKFRQFQPRCSCKIYSYKKKEECSVLGFQLRIFLISYCHI